MTAPNRSLSRRKLILRTSLGGVTALLGATGSSAQRPKKEPLKPELVREFVLVAHKDFDRVKELLSGETALLNSAWDWGGGDWETALGAAAHTGGRDIALYLLERGARIDLFAAAMLGNLEIVKATLNAYPEQIDARGPHGIPLVVHAQMGGKEAEKVLKYLQKLRPPNAPAEGGTSG